MDQKTDPKKVEIKVDEAIALGQYASLAAIRHSREEFLFDFAFLFPDGPFGKLVARIIVSPAHAKRFLEALRGRLRHDHPGRHAAPGGFYSVMSPRKFPAAPVLTSTVFFYIS
jgi:hypothetical protein